MRLYQISFLYCFLSMLLVAELKAQIPMDNLVGYYTFFNAGVDDSSGNENHLDDFDMALLRGDDRFDNFIESIVFRDTWIASLDTSMHNFAGDDSAFSISVWCKPDSIPPEWFGLVNNWAGFNNGGYFLGINPANTTIRFNLNMDIMLPTLNSSTIFALDEWIHIVGTYDGSEGKLYINGELESSYVYDAPLSTSVQPMFIARQGDQAAAFYFGSMDELLVYNRAITQEEVDQIFTRLPSSIDKIELADETVKLYPNPTSNLLTIQHETEFIEKVIIYDARGVAVHQENMGMTDALDVSSLGRGSYFARLFLANNKSLIKPFKKM